MRMEYTPFYRYDKNCIFRLGHVPGKAYLRRLMRSNSDNPTVKSKVYFVIDDDADDRQFLIEALLKNNPSSRCFTASNGQEAVSGLEDATIPLPDVIFLVRNMPVLNGRECLALLKRASSFRHIPVVIHSTTSHN